jgi:acetyl-CoA carboxylase biotin carboxyl carrier protein
MNLTHADIAEIIQLIDASTLDEMVVEVEGLRIEARRRGAVASSPVPTQPVASIAASAPISPAPSLPVPSAAAPSVALAAAPVAPTVGPGQVTVTAPMVGTFYRRPSPDAPPFAEVGSHVSADDPLCLVEVMKLYTTIHAGVTGTIVYICAEEASLVEYAQVLFVIEPD